MSSSWNKNAIQSKKSLFWYDICIILGDWQHISKNNKKLNKMKALRLIPVIALMVFASCSSSRKTAYDDTYYSPYGNQGSRMTTSNGSYVSPSVSSSSEYDYQAYYSDSKN